MPPRSMSKIFIPVGQARPWLVRHRVRLGFVLGVVSLWLARPTFISLTCGGLVAIFGLVIRLWASGHLDKGREVTTSGPYRWLRHPLYVGSCLLGVGVAVAASHVLVMLLVCVYLSLTLAMAIKTEEAELRHKFGSLYDSYCAGKNSMISRSFSFSRVRSNREHRAILGLLVVMVLLVLKTKVY